MTDQRYLNVAGRIVQGDVFTPNTTDMKGRPLTDKNGNPKVQYFIGLAVEKTAPDFQAAWDGINQVAMQGFLGGETQRSDFAWKVIDGDDPKNAGKEGFAGHWIFKFTSGFPFRAVTKGAAAPIADPNQIKRGYYIRMYFMVAANGDSMRPGVYLNGSIVELLGYGPEITSGPDAAAVIAQTNASYVPAGVQSTPVSGGMPGQPGAQPPAGGMPGQHPVQPHYGILTPGQGQ